MTNYKKFCLEKIADKYIEFEENKIKFNIKTDIKNNRLKEKSYGKIR